MIARFFKQSKPIVYIILIMVLTAFYLAELMGTSIQLMDRETIAMIVLKYLSLLGCFLIFDRCIKAFEIQRNHSFGGLCFVLFSSFFLLNIFDNFMIFGLLFFSIAMMRLLNILKTINPTLSLFEATFLMFLSGLFYEPFMYLLLLIFAATLIFLSPQWRFFVAPILAISAVVVLVQMYYLIVFDTIVYLDFFISEWSFNFNFNPEIKSLYMISFWVILSILCVYQIIKVKQKRSLYHKDMASFFLVFLGLSPIVYWLTNTSLSGLWLLSIWPLSIYIADFLNRLKIRFWLEVVFWSIVGFALGFWFI